MTVVFPCCMNSQVHTESILLFANFGFPWTSIPVRYPNHQAYRLPNFFADDWLNYFYDQRMRETESTAAGTEPTHGAAAVALGSKGCSAEGSECTAVSTTSHAETCSAAPSADQPQPPPQPPATFVSDYRFCYLGPAGTWTPLHSDVLRSYSWSANVCGRKRWLLLHPRHTHLLYDRQLLRMAPHLELERVESGCDPRDYPGLSAARYHAFELIQASADLDAENGASSSMRNLLCGVWECWSSIVETWSAREYGLRTRESPGKDR